VKRTRQKEVNAGSAADEIFLQPWYVPRDVYLEIRRVLPNIHLSKMRYYFEDYGCLKCGDRKALYGSNGLCEKCSVLIRGRVARCMERRLKKVGVVPKRGGISDSLASGMLAAKRLFPR
jgi:hypothetical protein